MTIAQFRTPSSNRILQRIAFLSSLLMIVAVVATGFSLRGSYNDAIEDSRKDADNIAAMLAGQVTLSVRGIDLLLDQVLDYVRVVDPSNEATYRDRIDNKRTFEFLVEQLKRLPQAEAITLIAPSGEAIVSTRGWPTEPRNLADRDYFRAQLNRGAPGTFVSEPVFGRTTGTYTMFFSRRIESKSGAFLGVLAIGTHPRHFMEAFTAISNIAGASSLLARRDGTIYLRYPDPVERTGARIPTNLGWYRMVAQGGGSYRTPGLFDEGARIAAVKPLAKYPLVASVAISEEQALSAWRARAKVTIASALLACGVMMWLLWLLYKNFSKVAQSESKLDAAVAHMSQGLVMFDRDNNLVMHNKPFCDMYKLDANALPRGTHRRVLLEQRIANGTHPIDDPDNFFPPESEVNMATARIDHLSDGRAILVTRRQVQDGGWVTTHEDITDRQRAATRIERMAHYDALTGLANRNMFVGRLQHLVTESRSGTVAVLLVDLDGFKLINDTYGHAIGDILLKAVADRLTAAIAPGDLAARLGGDEFAIVCQTEDKVLEHATAIARLLLDRCDEILLIEGKELWAACSIGVAVIREDAATPDLLLRQADLALYCAKAEGRKCYRVFEPRMEDEINERRRLTADLHMALEHNEFEVHYQPIVDVITGRACAMEALLRWRHQTKGIISPTVFIPLAEESGMINAIGAWVLMRACQDAMHWPEHVCVAVNFSALQVSRAEGAMAVRNALKVSGLAPDRLELEMTESVLLAGEAGNLDAMHELRRLGVTLSLDDFGTGFSSLSYLTTFAFDKIKIDKSFVDRISTNKGCASIVAATTSLARAFDAVTVAEGVETQQQHELLRAAGVNQVQGYLFGRPAPASHWIFIDGRARPDERLALIVAAA